MPIRCPLPTVISPSITLTPTDSGCFMRRRCSGLSGFPSTGYRMSEKISPRPSSGAPTPEMTRPRSCGPTGTVSCVPAAITSAPGTTPRISPIGIRMTLFLWKPTTSAYRYFPAPRRILHISPNCTAGPLDSIVSPTILSTFPVECITSVSSISFLYFERMSTFSCGSIFIIAVFRSYIELEFLIASSTVSSCVEMRASIAPTSVSIMQPPRSTRESS